MIEQSFFEAHFVKKARSSVQGCIYFCLPLPLGGQKYELLRGWGKMITSLSKKKEKGRKKKGRKKGKEEKGEEKKEKGKKGKEKKEKRERKRRKKRERRGGKGRK